jgi:hypothetical protein
LKYNPHILMSEISERRGMIEELLAPEDQKVWLYGNLPLPTFKKPFDETCEDEDHYWNHYTLEDGWMPPEL